jgi:hypothetical protein
MSDGANKTGNITVALITTAGVIIVAIITSYWNSPPKPSGTTIVNNNNAPVETKSPVQQLRFVVTVRDRDDNKPIGQATILLAVGNETVARAIADDKGQASFSVDGSYYGKRARLYAASQYYQPADLEVSLPVEPGNIIQLVSKKKPSPN